MPSKKYNGHKNYNFWNVALWFANDEGLYRMALTEIRRNDNRDGATRAIMGNLHDMGLTHTPDGAPYTKSAVQAALVGLE